MGASPLMSLGLTAMTASYAAMQATGHNIANANVQGYSRQQAELATAKGQYTGAGFMGKGVDVKTVSRAHDDFITRAASIAKSLSTMDQSRLDRLQQLEKVFPAGEGGLGNTISSFLNAMVDLASRPSDNATRQVVLARAQDLATRFNSASTQLDTVQAGVTQDLKTSVTAVNGLADSIAAINNQIAAARGLGQPPNDLLDERDRLVAQLASLVQVSTVEADDGTTGVFVAGGQSLVLGGTASRLVATLDPMDPSRAALAMQQGGGLRIVDENTLGGGSIAGLLQFQNTDLVDGRNLVGQLAASVAGAVNAQQLLGVNLRQPYGSVASQPMFAVGAPLALPASTNARDGSGAYVATVALTVVEPSALQPADYELRADPTASGMYVLTRRSSPAVERQVASGDVVDGMRIDVGAGGLGPTDRFLLQPVARAAGALERLLQDPKDLAAASPFVAGTAATNTGTMSVASLTMKTPPAAPGATAQIAFTSDAGDYAWTLLDADGATVLDSGTGTWRANAPIDGVNGFSLQLAGVPKSGDALSVAPVAAAYVASNNGNALALAQLRDATFVGRTQQADGTLSGGVIATDAYAAAMADIGVRVQTAKSSAAISASVAAQAEESRSDVAGVNLDEEAARLIQYQQSYQAAAKVLQIAQSVFQTLLETAGA